MNNELQARRAVTRLLKVFPELAETYSRRELIRKMLAARLVEAEAAENAVENALDKVSDELDAMRADVWAELERVHKLMDRTKALNREAEAARDAALAGAVGHA